MAGHSVFISYRRRDADGHARMLQKDLSRYFGNDRVFFDRSTIESGDNFPDELRQGVEECDALLALIGPKWLNRRLYNPDDFVRQEIALAIDLGKKVIPVLFDDTRVPPPDRLPDPLKALAKRDALTLRGKTYEYEVQLQKLVELLNLPPIWEELRNICKDITDTRMARVRKEYSNELYLQRNAVHEQIKTFLSAPHAHGFILVGKSGVGKSSFLLALAEELHAKSDFCVLMYHGASLLMTSSGLTDIITEDLRIRSRQPLQAWNDFARIEGIDKRKVVFCVDSVHENDQATALLKQLNDLVEKPWLWLKIIFTSRHETWRNITRKVTLTLPLYHREQQGERLGIELEPLSYSMCMAPFSSHDSSAELPEVYRKYKHVFTLQTDYDALSFKMRETLRDPFQLLLVAKMRDGQDIPENLTNSEKIIDEYVTAMENRKPITTLPGQMKQFLEEQLIPLMVRDGHYSNVVTLSELRAAGNTIYEMIYDVQKNTAFVKLCDADILVLEEHANEKGLKEQRIGFKYERFYEYFAGNRLASLGKTQNDRYAFFVALIEEAAGKPFMWGAVRNALAKEASEPSSETILKLCRTTKQRVKDMMVNVLDTLGLDSPEQVERILRNLVPQERQATEWQKIRYLVRKPAQEADLRTRSARKIAIEVASTLKLSSILQTAALHIDPTMRAMAVRYGYHLWQHDRAAGFAVLQHLADKATAGVIPNCLGLESIFALSLIIVCDSYQTYRDEEVLSRLQSIWRGMIAKLFRVQEGDSPWKGVVRDFIRERIIAFVIAHVFSLLRELPPNNMMHYDAIEAFFQLTPEDKQLYERLVTYFDVDGDYSKKQMAQDYLAVLKVDNVLMRLTTTMGLVAHASAAPHAFLPFLKQLFEAAKSDIATYPYLRAIHNVPISLLQRGPISDEIFNFFVYTAEVSQECYTQHPEKYQGEAGGPPPQAPGIGSYINFQYRRQKTVKTPWLETRIQAALKKPDLKLFEFLLYAEFPDQAINHRAPQAVLDALELFFDSRNAEITDMIQTFLSRLRLYCPDQVDAFLEKQQAPEEFRLQVRIHEPSEKVGDLIGMKAWYFVRDGALLGPAKGRAQLMGFFRKAAECKDTRVWMECVIRHLVNVIYGGEALREA